MSEWCEGEASSSNACGPCAMSRYERGESGVSDDAQPAPGPLLLFSFAPEIGISASRVWSLRLRHGSVRPVAARFLRCLVLRWKAESRVAASHES